MARCLTAAGAVRATSSTTPTATASLPEGSAFTMARSVLAATVLPASGGGTERQVQLIRDFTRTSCLPPRPICPSSPMRWRGKGSQAEANGLRLAVFGAEPCSEALRAEIEMRLGVDRSRFLRSVGSDGTGRRTGARRRSWKPRPLGGSFLSGDHRSRNRARASRWRNRRARPHHAHEGRHAGDPLSHARPDRAASAH